VNCLGLPGIRVKRCVAIRGCRNLHAATAPAEKIRGGAASIRPDGG
jgi:hypothetical protein